MITTGIHIPMSTRKHLTSAIACIHRETTNLTVGEIRNLYGDFDMGSLPYLFHVSFGKNGTVQDIESTPCQHGIENVGPDTFKIDVPLFNAAKAIARRKSWVLAHFLMKRELDRRTSMSIREMISFSDAELLSTIDELSPAFAFPYNSTFSCGELSELFKLRMAESELEIRKNESSHSRIKSMDMNEPFLRAAQKALEREKACVLEWIDAKRIRQADLYLPYQLTHRPQEEQFRIAYRNQRGW
ncbi:hypothetical protein ACR03S_08015 [Limimaricola variabilis]